MHQATCSQKSICMVPWTCSQEIKALKSRNTDQDVNPTGMPLML